MDENENESKPINVLAIGEAVGKCAALLVPLTDDERSRAIKALAIVFAE